VSDFQHECRIIARRGAPLLGTGADSERIVAESYWPVPPGIYNRYGKRMIEVLVVVLLVPAAVALIAVCAILIKIFSPGPVFYRQERVGQGGKPFWLVKLRTMVANAETTTGPVWAGDDDPRITVLGRWLRRARLDELPQLFQVLTGKMALIGPRPERHHFVRELARHLPFYLTRLSVRPGITGWAQINHCYDTCLGDVREKLWYDLYYIRHLSLGLDMEILRRTFGVVVRGSGAR